MRQLFIFGKYSKVSENFEKAFKRLKGKKWFRMLKKLKQDLKPSPIGLSQADEISSVYPTRKKNSIYSSVSKWFIKTHTTATVFSNWTLEFCAFNCTRSPLGFKPGLPAWYNGENTWILVLIRQCKLYQIR